MAYINCSTCNTAIHFKPKDLNEIIKRFIVGNEPIYCIKCKNKIK